MLEGLRDVLSRRFDVRVAGSGPEALEQLEQDRYGYAVVVSDMRMPGMDGASFLSEAQRIAPLAVRMLLTGYADTEAAARAVNDGQIFRFLVKPCDADQLNSACIEAAGRHRQMLAERVLVEQAVDGSLKALTEALKVTAPAVLGEGRRAEQPDSQGRLDEPDPSADDGAAAAHDHEPTLTLGEAAEALGMSASTLRRWADAGRIRSIRTSGGHRRFPMREVQRLARLAQHEPVVRSVQPPVGPLPALGELLTAAAADLAGDCAPAVYDGTRTGWFVSPAGRDQVERWALGVAAGARTGDYDATAEATRKLMLQAYHTGASLLERYTMLERVGAIVLRDLQERGTEGSEILGARRLFVHLRQLVLEADDARG